MSYPGGNGEFRLTPSGKAGTVLSGGHGKVPEGTTSAPDTAEARSTGNQDVEMESVGSPDQPITAWEYDPDDIDLGQPARATVATTTTTTSSQATNVPRIRVSAMSKLKVFSAKDGDDDRARSKLVPPAEPHYPQYVEGSPPELSRSILWTGRLVARQYYHARKRSDESPLEYLHRLNVAGLRTRLQIKDRPTDVWREHVEHFIETLDDCDLAGQLALLRVLDADTLEEVLRSRQRAKSRQSKTVYGSIKPRQKVQPREHEQFGLFRYPGTAVTPTTSQGAHQMEDYVGCTSLQGRSKIKPKINVSQIKPKSRINKIITSINTPDRRTKGRHLKDARIADLGGTTIVGAEGV
ncbi:unnamed protein product [Phytophthora fragariaefolia]|uniref:Unnamed protein product n=1 Tax=Phytophthora fragariaefolia TaxID=1490495 RepID=A0A9W6YQL7_9STRA|nr:unnamed protein product [Phytophthora fragariaefolia]